MSSRINLCKACERTGRGRELVRRPTQQFERPEQACVRRRAGQPRALVAVTKHRSEERLISVSSGFDRIEELRGSSFGEQWQLAGERAPNEATSVSICARE